MDSGQAQQKFKTYVNGGEAENRSKTPDTEVVNCKKRRKSKKKRKTVTKRNERGVKFIANRLNNLL